MANGVLHQRLDRHGGHDRRQCLGSDINGDVQAVAKPGLLEAQVPLNVLELLAQRHIRAPVAEQVARELGEIDQKLARLLGAGVNVARHRCQRVVDEVRGNLGPQRAQLRLRNPLLLLGHH